MPIEIETDQLINAESGDLATYTSTNLEDVSCYVILEHDVVLQVDGMTSQVAETGTTITALYSDVGKPEAGSSFLIGENTYRVVRVTDNNRILVTMAVVDEGDGWS